MKKLTFLFLMTLLPLMASAEAVEIDGIYYNLNTSGNTAEVTENPNKYTGSVNIPKTVIYDGVTYNVTSIGRSSFHLCTDLTSVTIPNSVTSIGTWAFFNCTNLTSVTIPNSVTSMGYQVFYKCSGLKSVTIPNSVTYIGEGGFRYCSSLSSIIIPNSIIYLEKSVFSDCSGLTSVTIPNSVSYIGGDAFHGCTSLTSVTIPNSVVKIESGAFYGCTGLTDLKIESGERKHLQIFNAAFFNCSGLTSLTIPKVVANIQNRAFAGCSNLASIVVESGNPKYDSRENCNAIIETSSNTLITGCKNTVIPNSVTSVGYGAFQGCSGLTSVTIPDGVTEIGDFAFYNCTSLIDVSCYANNVPVASGYTFGYIPAASATLRVPAASVNDYKSTDYWSEFGTIVAISDEPVVEGIAINETNFPDENFRKWILSQEYGQDGVLTDEEIAEVTYIGVSYQNISNLKGIEYFTALKNLQVSSGILTSLDVSKNTALEYLDCSCHMITSLDLSQNKALKNLSCWGNALTSLDVSECTALQSIDCKYNLLTSLDVSGCTALQKLDCERNQLTSVDVSNKKELFWLTCYNNQLTTLDVSGCPYLSVFSFYCNQIKGAAMDKLVEGLPALDYENPTGVIYFENEGNVMTTTQVAAARAKNWIPGYAVNENDWRDYEGSEPDPVFLRGDVNGDGVVNGTDIQEIINIIVNEE